MGEMKRDWDLIRSMMLLMETEEQADEQRLKTEIDTHPENIRNEHWALLIEAGLLEGAIQRNEYAVGRVLPGRITWAGHDFLAAIHDDNLWKKVTKSVKSSAGSMTLDILKEVLQQASKAALKEGLRQIGVAGF